MTTVQIIGIAVASLAILLLIIALIVTRRRDEPHVGDAQQEPGSFLDEAPQDTLAGLGKAEWPVEDVTGDPAVREEAAPARADGERQAQPGGLGLDWSPDLSVRTASSPAAAGTPPASADTSIPVAGEPGITRESAPDTQPPRPVDGGTVAAGAARPDPGSGRRLVPLSDIIVTTSSKMVDLGDPEIRRMLTELVTFEIDQAEQLRRQGQTVDAVLQLTEAEKVSRALGMNESAQRIRTLLEEMRGT